MSDQTHEPTPEIQQHSGTVPLGPGSIEHSAPNGQTLGAQECPNCGAENHAAATICHACGEHLRQRPKTIRCRQCGQAFRCGRSGAFDECRTGGSEFARFSRLCQSMRLRASRHDDTPFARGLRPCGTRYSRIAGLRAVSRACRADTQRNAGYEPGEVSARRISALGCLFILRPKPMFSFTVICG